MGGKTKWNIKNENIYKMGCDTWSKVVKKMTKFGKKKKKGKKRQNMAKKNGKI